MGGPLDGEVVEGVEHPVGTYMFPDASAPGYGPMYRVTARSAATAAGNAIVLEFLEPALAGGLASIVLRGGPYHGAEKNPERISQDALGISYEALYHPTGKLVRVRGVVGRQYEVYQYDALAGTSSPANIGSEPVVLSSGEWEALLLSLSDQDVLARFPAGPRRPAVQRMYGGRLGLVNVVDISGGG
ncbi:MAG: hypothetical protein JO079_13585, partial [Frankiaceae bacterium]|nr:hypothetical protein [Frankiaceae bacterium]